MCSLISTTAHQDKGGEGGERRERARYKTGVIVDIVQEKSVQVPRLARSGKGKGCVKGGVDCWTRRLREATEGRR